MKAEGKGLNLRWISSIKEAMALPLQDLRRSIADRTLGKTFVHRVAKSHGLNPAGPLLFLVGTSPTQSSTGLEFEKYRFEPLLHRGTPLLYSYASLHIKNKVH